MSIRSANATFLIEQNDTMKNKITLGILILSAASFAREADNNWYPFNPVNASLWTEQPTKLHFI